MAVTVGYVAASVPLLSTPALADTVAEVVDTHAVNFLLKQALKERKQEEERRMRRQKEVEGEKKVKESLERAQLALERDTRKRKKRKKRKLP